MPQGLPSKKLPVEAARVTERLEEWGARVVKSGQERLKILQKESTGPLLPEIVRKGIPPRQKLKQAKLATGTRKGLANIVPLPGTDYPPPPASSPFPRTSLIHSPALQGELASKYFHFISLQTKAQRDCPRS